MGVLWSSFPQNIQDYDIDTTLKIDDRVGNLQKVKGPMLLLEFESDLEIGRERTKKL